MLRIRKALGVSPAEAEQLLHDLYRHSEPDHELLDFATSTGGRVRTGILANAGPAARWGLEAILELQRVRRRDRNLGRDWC